METEKKKQECKRKCIKAGRKDCGFQNEDEARVWIWVSERRGSSRLDLGFMRLDLFHPRWVRFYKHFFFMLLVSFFFFSFKNRKLKKFI